ncbi:hypothetical protein JN11_04885 [Mucilaginibacter frigoritolerans]|uniref:Uncharacterized protein n=1 Tax=Mucilaginibacter frigoritolerans TaxID=652788 RepID=A0A562TM48_9SPHI|nr:hypothetical protein JN11_04885 [Mucilaginibacter frigoritolerans]
MKCTFLILTVLFTLQGTVCFSQSANCKDCCEIDFNRDFTLKLKNPIISSHFKTDVLPSLFALSLINQRSFGEYSLSFDSLMKVTGLYTLFGNKILHSCCDCCPGASCGTIVLKRIGMTNQANFTIHFNNVSTNYSISSNQYNNDFDFESPTTIRGIATFSSAYIKFYFTDPNVNFTVTDVITSKVITKIKIQCITINQNGITYIPQIEKRPFMGIILPMIIYR